MLKYSIISVWLLTYYVRGVGTFVQRSVGWGLMYQLKSQVLFSQRQLWVCTTDGMVTERKSEAKISAPGHSHWLASAIKSGLSAVRSQSHTHSMVLSFLQPLASFYFKNKYIRIYPERFVGLTAWRSYLHVSRSLPRIENSHVHSWPDRDSNKFSVFERSRPRGIICLINNMYAIKILTKRLHAPGSLGCSGGLLTADRTPQQEAICKCLEVAEAVYSTSGKGNESLCSAATRGHCYS
jgi:hypothetical protein